MTAHRTDHAAGHDEPPAPTAYAAGAGAPPVPATTPVPSPAIGRIDPRRPDDTVRVSRRRLIAFYVVVVVGGLSLGLTAPLTAVFAVELGASPFAASVSVASLTGVVLVLDLLGTRYLPFLEPRRAIAIGMLLWSIGSLASAAAPTFAFMAGARLLQGFGLALYASAGPQLAIKMAGANRVGTAMGRFQAAMTLGAAIAPLTGGAIADVTFAGAGPSIGLRLAFAVCGALALTCAVAAAVVIPTVRPRLRPRLGLPHLPGMLHRRPMVALWMGAVGQGARGALATALIPLVVAEGMGHGGTMLGVLLTSVYAVEVLTMTVGGAWSDRRGRRRLILVSTVCGALGTGVLGYAVLTGSLPALFAAVVPLGIAGGGMLGLLPAVLVDLSGSPEVGLSATRISRDLGFTGCTVATGAALSVGGAVGGLAVVGGCFVLVTVMMVIVGETRTRR